MGVGNWVRNANWFMVYYLSVVHIGAVLGIMRLMSCEVTTILYGLLFHVLSGLGITMGCHRLWAHRSYKAHSIVRFPLMLMTSLANQGTIYHWSRDHRVHHKFSDTAADPHDSNRGLFFAHMGWLLLKKDPRVYQAGSQLPFEDLKRDWVVALQMKLNPWGQLFMCFVVPTLIPVYTTQETWLNALLICGFLRYATALHVTWLVNSVVHVYGSRPYDPTIPPTENSFVAFLALGEGWHNWHHTFPYDYATSEHGIFRQVNPTKGIIDFLALFGLIYDRKRALNVWHKMQEKSAAAGPTPKDAVSPLENKAANEAYSRLVSAAASK